MGQAIAAELTTPHLATRAVYPLWLLLEDRYGSDTTEEIFSTAGVPRSYLQRSDQWVSRTFIRRLTLAVGKRLFGLEALPGRDHPMWQLWRDAGRRGLSPEGLGAGAWYFLRAFGAPAPLYRHMPSILRNSNRMTQTEVLEQGPGYVTLACSSVEEREWPAFCASRLGYFESMPTVWNLPLALIDHSECQHDPLAPAERCVYRITFRSRQIGWMSMALGTLLGAGVGVALQAALPFVASYGVASVVGAVTGMGLGGVLTTRRTLQRQQGELAHLGEAVGAFDERYRSLRESDLRLRALLGNIREALWLATPDRSRFEYVSPVYERLFECDAEQLIDDPTLWWQRVHDDDREALSEALASNADEAREFIYRLRYDDGRELTVREQTFPIVDERGTLYALAGVTEDISERLSAQQELARRDEQLHQAQKLEAIGRLAGGVAHDFNNILMVIAAAAQMAQRQLPAENDAAEDIAQIRASAEHAGRLTSQLLAFSRRQRLSLTARDLNQVVRDGLRMLRHSVPPTVVLERDLALESLPVLADETQLTQVLLNLALNACDAMVSGGSLRIATESRLLDHEIPHRHGTVTPGHYHVLSVEDTGVGMSAEERTHIFEPFYTTKPRGKGTGLGLASALGIIGQHRGAIVCESELGRGTCFSIFLPATEEEVIPIAAAPPTVVPAPPTTILLIEDDEGVRRLIARVLRDDGHTVFTSETSSAAVELGRDLDHPIELVITDVVMPGYSGPEAVRAIRELRPDVRVLYVTGFSRDRIPQGDLCEGQTELLAKPFDATELSLRVASLLRSVPPILEHDAPFGVLP